MLYLNFIFVSRSTSMLYQLPNGNVLYLSIEEFLSLSDEELHSIVNTSRGEDSPSRMFYGKNSTEVVNDETDVIVINDLDFSPEYEETDVRGPLKLEDLPDEGH